MRGILIGIVLLAGGLAVSSWVAAAEKPNETFWELLDKRDFHVTVTPWPLKASEQLKIHGVAEEIEDGKFKGTIEYRIVTDKESKAPWTAMTQVKGKNDKDVEFEATAKAPDAKTVFVQFKIKQAEQEPIELTDWSLELQK